MGREDEGKEGFRTVSDQFQNSRILVLGSGRVLLPLPGEEQPLSARPEGLSGERDALQPPQLGYPRTAGLHTQGEEGEGGGRWELLDGESADVRILLHGDCRTAGKEEEEEEEEEVEGEEEQGEINIIKYFERKIKINK